MNATIREIVETTTLVILVFFLLQTTIQNYRVFGSSMDPELFDQELVLVNKAVYTNVDLNKASRYLRWLEPEEDEFWFLFHPPRQGDVVVFQNPLDPAEPDFVKRIIAEPGDSIEIIAGQVIVNDKILEENYIEHHAFGSYPRTVMEDAQYFVMGDNRLRSEDSRFFGGIRQDTISGKILLRYWPLKRFSFLKVIRPSF
jgi:signal peptidase I